MVETSACGRHCGAAEANAFGTAHGGVILSLANRCGQEAVMKRHPEQPVFTDEVIRLDFLGPVAVGDVMEASAHIEEGNGTMATVKITVRTGKAGDKTGEIAAIATIRYRIGFKT